ncbi:MAG TPA: PAS domain S-box protein [Kamptonema sp.]|nr:PAS domain S-box protein [Kamptonema sp.]
MKRLKILLLEDSVLDAELIEAHLIEGAVECDLFRVETRSEFLAALTEKSFDLILADYSLPSFDGISALAIARSNCPEIPFIFVSATLGEELAVETLKNGATDYVVKQRLGRLVPAVKRALRESQERRDRASAEAARQESEDRFQIMADTAPVMIWMSDTDKLYYYFNKRWLEFTGKTLEVEAGNGWTQGIHPEDCQRCVDTYITAFDARLEFKMEYRLQRHDGEYRWLLDTGVPRFGPDGAFVGYIGSCIDIHDRIQAENERAHSLAVAQATAQALAASEARYRAIGESIPFGVWICNADGSVNYISDSFLNLIGMTLEECQQLGLAGRLPPEEVDRTSLEWKKCIESGSVWDCEHKFLGNDGNYRTVLSRGVPVRDASGQILNWVGINLDITERKQVEASLQEANQQIVNILESIDDGFISFDAEWHFIYVNRKAEELLRKTRSQLCGQIFWEVFPQMQDTPYYELILQAKANSATFEYEHFFPPLDKWFAGRWHPTPEGMCVYFQDISQRKYTEAALKATEEKLKSFVDTASIGIIFGNIYGEITEANDEFLRIVGYTRDRLQRGELRWIDITPPEYLPLDAERIQEAQENGTCTPYEKEYILPDGSRVWVLVGFIVVGEQREETVAFILDLTDRKQLEATLRQRAEELVQANRIKDEFLATLSHELRTPLNAMLGWTQLLRSRKFDEHRTAKALETIDRNTKSLATLIEDLLDVSRIITGKLRLNLRSVDLLSVVEAAIETIVPAAEAKSIQIIPLFSSQIERISGDSGRLQQVVWNLISNAIKFTPNGGRVTIALRKVGNETEEGFSAEIEVSDTGQGISPEFLPYVFDRFSQADSTTTRLYTGLGLGLAIVRHLVELHGGTVKADSPGNGKGSIFTVRLPLPERNKSEELSSHQVSSPIPVRNPLEGLRVLVVDDEADSREFVRAVLEDSGAEVIAAASAQEAIETIKILKPDVLLSDIGMPQEDGYALIRQVRALSSGSEIPAAALTAYARAEDRARSLREGFQIHLPKPIDPDELIAVVISLKERLKLR